MCGTYGSMVSRGIDIPLLYLRCIMAFLASDLTGAGCFNERHAMINSLNRKLYSLSDRHYSECEWVIQGQPPLWPGWCLNNSMSTTDQSPVYFKNNSNVILFLLFLLITLPPDQEAIGTCFLKSQLWIKPNRYLYSPGTLFLHKKHAYQITPSSWRVLSGTTIVNRSPSFWGERQQKEVIRLCHGLSFDGPWTKEPSKRNHKSKIKVIKRRGLSPACTPTKKKDFTLVADLAFGFGGKEGRDHFLCVRQWKCGFRYSFTSIVGCYFSGRSWSCMQPQTTKWPGA